VIVVSNTTPLSELAKVGQMGLLGQVFGQVIIPQEVFDEVTTGTHPAVSEVNSSTWIQVRSISHPEQILTLQAETGLDVGECAAIVLAEELEADIVLIDEWAGRKVAQSRNLTVTGTAGTLLVAKKRGLISQVKPILDALMAQGMRISNSLYQQILAVAQES
jgi:predicted nucleic acid-binding protein